jgi:hypothetical protein
MLSLVLLLSCPNPVPSPEPPDDDGLDDDDDSGPDDDDDDSGASDDDDSAPEPLGYAQFVDRVQPGLVESCSACHLGDRFAFASLRRAGEKFTDQESAENYETVLDLISLDAPLHSRLLAKVVPEEQPEAIQHAGGRLLEADDPLHTTLVDWILREKEERCPLCGTTAPTQYIAYVDTPNLYWALERAPIRTDHGLRDGSARIMLQPLDPETLAAQGGPVDFLDGQLCNEASECDFGHLAVSHAGDRMVFECRLPVQAGDDWVDDVTWNLCIAEIGEDGRAQDPRFLMPPERRHRGRTFARGTPFGLYHEDGGPLRGIWDHHFTVRKSDDLTPVFSPDDQRIHFASRGPEPRSGQRATRTYHGFEFVDNILSVRTDGTDPRVTYLNEGGTADHPTFLRDGLLAVHVWNLERMDRHLYIRTTPDGMMELPPLFGRFQGNNMWGKAVQLANGTLLGMTGRRRASVDLWEPFLADHTLGTGFEEGLTSYALLDPEIDTLEPNFGYCSAPPDGPNCVVGRFYADPAWSPDGRAFVALNPEPTYVTQGEILYITYSSGDSTEERLASLAPYLPQNMGIWLVDHRGGREAVIEPEAGRMLRYPAWVGARHPPRQRAWVTDEEQATAELHIANVPIWMSFADNHDGENKTVRFGRLATIESLRILVKVLHGNDCTTDGRPYRNAVHDVYDHPTHLGINNATGYERLVVPEALGGDGWGDVALEADGSVRVVLPAGELLLFQGIDADGNVVRQHARVFALPPGQTVETGVRTEQYATHCSACHGVIDGSGYQGLQATADVPAIPMDFDTEAAAQDPVDLTGPEVERQPMTFLHQLRPLLDVHCVSCHSGSSPAGELSLEAEYSPVANYPAASWLDELDFGVLDLAAELPESARVPAHNFSVPWSFLLREDGVGYTEAAAYATLVDDYAPLGELAPWDPGYQNLMLNLSGGRYFYLGGDGYASHYGRADRLGGNAQDAWLIEILTGQDLEPERDFAGPDHTGYLDDAEVRLLVGIMDVGFPYMSRCDDRVIPSGPNAGEPWGDPEAIGY